MLGGDFIVIFLIHVPTGPDMSTSITSTKLWRLPSWLILPGMILWPVGALRRVQSISWPAAVTLFLGGSVIGFISIQMMRYRYQQALPRRWTMRDPFSVRELFPAMPDNWSDAVILLSVTSLIIGAICLMPLIVSLFTLGWAGRDEPARVTLLNNLRRIMALTPHYVLMITAISVIILWLNLQWEYFRHAHRGAWYSQGSWPVRHMEEISYGLIIAAILWAFILTIRAVRTARWGGRSFWPPLCQQCGYSLSGLPTTGDCPECGRTIAASLSHDSRPGSPLEQRDGSRLYAWFRCFVQPVFMPRTFGKQLRLGRPAPAAGYMLAGNLMLLGLFVTLIMFFSFITFELLAGTPLDNVIGEMVLAVEGSVYVYSQLAVSVLLFNCFISSLLGVIFRRPDRRPLLNVATQATCYASSFLFIWIFILWLPAYVLEVYLLLGHDRIARRYVFGVDMEIMMLWVMLGIFCVCLLIYIFLCARITRAARWTNW